MKGDDHLSVADRAILDPDTGDSGGEDHKYVQASATLNDD